MGYYSRKERREYCRDMEAKFKRWYGRPFSARYPGCCNVCSERFKAGDMVCKHTNYAAYAHEACADKRPE